MANTQKSKVWLIVLIVILAILAAGYLAAAYYFQNHFYPRTTINGTDYSLKTVEDVENKLKSNVESYILAVHDRDGRVTYISADQIDYKYSSDGSVQKLMDGQDSLKWPLYILHKHEYTATAPASFDETKLETVVKAMDCFKAENITEPVNAYIENTGSGFEIVPEVQGSKPIEANVLADVKEAVSTGATELTLDDSDYEAPTVLSTDESLNKELENLNKYKDMVITLDMYGSNETTEVISGDTIMSWVSYGSDNTVTVDETKVTSYVQQLASKYNTYAKERTFKTTKGDEITIGGGDYGWIIDKDAEVKKLISDVKGGESVEEEPEYTQRAFVTGSDDIGNTYIELDYTNQHLYYYKDGELVVDSDFVSGNTTNGRGSPDGVFKIITLKSPATLVGEDYSSPVTYFMPFAYNVGLHDASWRSEFGGEIYKTSGSHGCVNLPTKTAKKIFNTVEIGTPVIAYYRESVKLTSNNAKVSNAYSYSD